jgi:hypothetical protein
VGEGPATGYDAHRNFFPRTVLGHGLSQLVMDDNEDAAHTLAMLLEAMNYEVFMAFFYGFQWEERAGARR